MLLILLHYLLFLEVILSYCLMFQSIVIFNFLSIQPNMCEGAKMELRLRLGFHLNLTILNFYIIFLSINI